WIIEPFQCMADRVKQVAVNAGRNGHAGAGSGDVRVAAKVMIRNRVMPGRRAVVAPQPMAPIIARPALLGETGSRLKSPAIGVHPEIPSPYVHLNCSSRGDEALISSPL